MKPFFLIFLILPLATFSQNKLNGVILDSKNNSPIEFVDIHDNYNFTYSNENGKFFFESDQDTVYFNLLGYKGKSFNFKDLKLNDTIYLEPKAYELEEIVVSDRKPSILRMYKSIRKNYQLTPYKEEFFLRSVLKKNGKILELQDIYGEVERNTLLYITNESEDVSKNYKFNIKHMRKAGIKDKYVDVRTYGLRELFNKFVTTYTSPEIYNFRDKVSKDSLSTKIYYEAKNPKETSSQGYYIMNNSDNSFGEFYINVPNPDPEGERKSGIKYQTTGYEMRVWFFKDIILNRYHVKKARLNLSLEVELDNGQSDTYNSSFFLHSKPIEYEKSIKNNVSQKKDLFELRKKYDKNFWETQSTLKLSDEMIMFLESLERNKEFKHISNIRN